MRCSLCNGRTNRTGQRDAQPKCSRCRKVEPYQESPAVIDAAFKRALAEVKRTPREVLSGWSSPLARIV